MKKIVLFLLFTSTIKYYAQTANDIIGNWLTSDGERKINIYKQGDKYFGKIFWVKMTDKKNEINKIVMMDLVYENGEYEQGTFLMPSDKHNASCAAKILKSKILKVSIYHGLQLFGHSLYLSKIIDNGK